MISDYLDREYVLSETLAQRDWLADLRKKALKKDKAAVAELRKHKVTTAQLARAVAALDDALVRAKTDTKHPQGSAYIPNDPVTCGLQKGLTKIAVENGLVQSAAPAPAAAGLRRGGGPAAARVVDTSPTLRLRPRAAAAPQRATTRGLRAAFVEGEDPRYGLDGFKAKFGALFTTRRAFNSKPARVALSAKPLRLFVFGDWGTGLGLAREVTQRIREQLAATGSARQCHVIHLGDVYYVGDADEYRERMFPIWPVTSEQRNVIGSWSLNGNHDMYSGGAGYFDTLLRKDYMLRWHGDADGEPSSFFLIEDKDWQVFGLDTSWNLPSLGSAVFGKPTLKDYGGQNGVLTQAQATWMARVRNKAKGCILLTHHQPSSSRTVESQHADEAVAMLKAAGVYAHIDAWIWGHEHRCVVFKPKAARKTARLKDAPGFCACLGHGGVPVTKKNLAVESRIADVLWEEDRLDADAPMYEGQRVVPFGFATIDTKPGEFDFAVFDHAGKQRFSCTVPRDPTKAAPPTPPAVSRRKPATRKATAKRGK